MNAVINLNKPAHITSQQAVIKVKRLLGAKKAGHAGTLDPIATGVLIVCLDEATKITRFLSDLDKEYVVQMKLGERTDTYDSTGKIVETKDAGLLREADVKEALSGFTGIIQQTPPMFSAVKMGGQRLYKLARKGISIERPERSVQIRQAELLSFHPPYVNARVICSKGTYIRTLCDDIGNALGTGAHMTQLMRSGAGSFRVEDAVSLAELPHMKYGFYSMDEALSHLKEITLDHDSLQKAKNGAPVRNPGAGSWAFGEGFYVGPQDASATEPEFVRLKGPDRALFGVGSLQFNSLKPVRLFHSL